jgi:hypothetical protein
MEFLILTSIVILNFAIYILTRRIDKLDERLTKLEKDAIKVTYKSPFSPQDEKPIGNQTKIKSTKK